MLLSTSLMYSQFEDSINLHNLAREIHPYESTDYEKANEGEECCEIELIKYDVEYSKIAQKRADLLAKEFFEFHKGDENYNFWFTEIPVDEKGKKEFTDDENYVRYAVLDWIKIDIDYDKYYEGNQEPLTIRDSDIASLQNAVGYYNTKVGFAISKSDQHVFVVAFYGDNE